MISIKKARRDLFFLGLMKIPMIGYVGPKIIEMDENRMVIMIPYKRRTLNHLKSIYMGAMVIGADLVAGFHAYALIESMEKKVSIVFSSFSSQFLKRAESDVYFVCDQGAKMQEMINSTIESGERVTEDIHFKAFTHYPNAPEPVAEFTLGLSLKSKQIVE